MGPVIRFARPARHSSLATGSHHTFGCLSTLVASHAQWCPLCQALVVNHHVNSLYSLAGEFSPAQFGSGERKSEV